MKNKELVNKEFDNLFNSLGYDNWDSCKCGFLETCSCISGREQLTTFSSSIRQNDVDELIRVADVMQDKQSLKEMCPHLVSGEDKECFVCWEDNGIRTGYNAALSDIITHLKSIKEKI